MTIIYIYLLQDANASEIVKENGDAECITPNGNAATEESSTAVDNVTAPLAPSLSLPPSTQAPDGVNNDNEEEEMVTITLPTVTDVYFIIIDCTTMGYVDSVGVKILQQVKEIFLKKKKKRKLKIALY